MTFENILRAHQGPIRDMLAGMGVAPTSVDDIAQETFLVYYQAPEKRPEAASVLAWLKGIARNLANEHFRKQASLPRRLDWVFESDQIPSAIGSLPETPRLDALRKCMGMLDDDHRSLLQRYYSDADAVDIGSDTGRSVNALRKLMLRLRERLRDCILKRVAMEER